jgi:hypothetical protein
MSTFYFYRAVVLNTIFLPNNLDHNLKFVSRSVFLNYKVYGEENSEAEEKSQDQWYAYNTLTFTNPIT